MANYVAHYHKKVYALARRERDLIRLLEQNASEQQVAMAAEEVRSSQIRVHEAKRAQIPPIDDNAKRLKAIDDDIRSCLKQSVADIISLCQQRESKTGGK